MAYADGRLSTGAAMNARPNGDHELLMTLATDMAAMRARLDATLPQLASREDVEKGVNRALRWLIGALVAGFVSVGGIFMNMSHEFHSENVALRTAMQEQQRWQTQQLQGQRVRQQDQLQAKSARLEDQLLAQSARLENQMKADREATHQDIQALVERTDRILELLQSSRRR
jgi:hypothetical protein